jgi:hypothetical protein
MFRHRTRLYLDSSSSSRSRFGDQVCLHLRIIVFVTLTLR